MENAPYLILAEDAEGEIQEKKSRFIARLHKTDSEEEASSFIQQTKKKYWDARHNCSAFVIGENNEITRCSDDGEPSGTAGRPMLDVLINENIHDVAVVVTRYFGGVLLGTGGLVRAYQKSVQEGIAASKLAIMRYGYPFTVVTDYNGLGKLEYIVRTEQIQIADTRYTENVEMDIIVPENKKEHIIDTITEATNGTAQIKIGDLQMYAANC